MAKKLGIVHCRVCKGDIDRNIEQENIDWISPSKNFYYHKECYENWKKKTNDIHAQADEKMWKDAVYDYLRRDKKIVIDYLKMDAQWKALVKKGRTPKGIYFCVRYFYDVQNGDPSKAQGGIGIVDYIYEEGCNYWASKEIRERGLIAKIEQQMKDAQNQETIVIKKTKDNNKKKKVPTLAEIGEGED